MATMEGWSDRTARLLVFDGKHSKFTVWWTKFTTYAIACNFREALTPEFQAMLPTSHAVVLDETLPTDLKMYKAKKMNALAMNAYAMAFQSTTNIVMINRARTKDWPDGLAHKVTTALLLRYRPRDTMTKVELRQQLNQVLMGADNDPAKIFYRLSKIETEFLEPGDTIDKQELIAVVLDAAPMDYQPVLTAEQQMRGASLNLSDLETVMHQFWRQKTHAMARSGASSTASEVSLSAFVGKCYHCNEIAHRKSNCPKIASGNDGRLRHKCNLCGKQGHQERFCWEKEENKDIRPAGWVTVKERVAVSVNAGPATIVDYEVTLCGLTFDAGQHLLDDPNLWIADSAATVHNTPHAIGLTNVQAAGDGNGITMGNGANVIATMIADMRGSLCDKFGARVRNLKLTDVTVLPKGKCTFSA